MKKLLGILVLCLVLDGCSSPHVYKSESSPQNALVSNLERAIEEDLHFTDSLQNLEPPREQNLILSNLNIRSISKEIQLGLVSRIGFEPTTPSLKGKCSTN